MKSLVDNARSFATALVADPERAERFRALESGQSPEVLFISCADSRVVPALITGAHPGELFELRTAGNIVPAYRSDRPTGEAATVEFAVSVLGVRDIVVCGHSQCGAIGAVVRGDDLSSVPAVRGWLEHALPSDAPARTVGRGSGDLTEAVTEAAQRHAVAQLETLRSYPCVQRRLARGQLSLHAWYYEVHTGVVSAHRPEDGVLPFPPL
ncbi:carbonic anhydrase [Streptomyces sp. AV19]|uniref:carbonic anhydrase n=1 Tax=Streptomyces sp. AV19 TaxID=2793068 RepID=UPI0018FEE89C|nr:carbonic anhydrase [Streptomyces sp. AV19]MBH1935750.1 carbonic anhydrase [Streptomyces sp. AV19]MDG4535976.1 carbonic anhydrase [Streptomyces sp. AV19]